jgi:hypothetical protein
MSTAWIVVLVTTSVFVAGIWLGRKSKHGEIDRLKNSIDHHKYQMTQFVEQAKEAIHTLRTEQVDQQSILQNKENTIAKIKSELTAAREREKEQEKINNKLYEIYTTTLEKLRTDGATLPSVVRWANTLRESLDQIIVNQLVSPPHPAPSAAAQVKETRALARQWQQEAELLRNRLDLYEAQAPWLVEYSEYSVDEIIAGLQEEKEFRRSYDNGDDPVKIFLSPGEISKLSNVQRNQLALDRYWEASRKRSAWTAGIQYERYIGYLYEREGCEVKYHGALRGKEDLGIDLICRKGDHIKVVQCKRLSPLKAIPVRENVIAQIFGAAMFFSMREGVESSLVDPVIVTSYELSNEARQFAELLGVLVRENVVFEKYPCIKCNISGRSGERIYHLPFDQQYDSTKIGNVDGEFYAMTVIEAEKAKFRRAFRWRGQTS